MKGGEKMATTKLEMEFLDFLDKKFTLRVDNPKTDLSEGDVSQAMNSILTHNIFSSGNSDLKIANDARLITTTVNKLKI